MSDPIENDDDYKEKHNHWSRFAHRIEKRLVGGRNREYLQCICILDGLIFHEVEVKEEKPNDN